jgi:nicotinamidase-related amidase
MAILNDLSDYNVRNTAFGFIDCQTSMLEPDSSFKGELEYEDENFRQEILGNIRRLVTKTSERLEDALRIFTLWASPLELTAIRKQPMYLLKTPWQQSDARNSFMQRINPKFNEPQREDFHPQVRPSIGDVIIEKPYRSAFSDTDLAKMLCKLGCKALVLSGVRTDKCIYDTAFDGGGCSPPITCIVVEDAVGTQKRDKQRDHIWHMKNQLELVKVTTTQKVCDLLDR